MIALILALTTVPSFETMPPIDLVVGSGPTVEAGDRYTISFRVDGVSSKHYADTYTRGLSYTKELGDGHDGYFDEWVSGMSAGSLRQVFIDGNRNPGAGDVLPPRTDVVVTIRLLSVKKKRGP